MSGHQNNMMHLQIFIHNKIVIIQISSGKRIGLNDWEGWKIRGWKSVLKWVNEASLKPELLGFSETRGLVK